MEFGSARFQALSGLAWACEHDEIYVDSPFFVALLTVTSFSACSDEGSSGGRRAGDDPDMSLDDGGRPLRRMDAQVDDDASSASQDDAAIHDAGSSDANASEEPNDAESPQDDAGEPDAAEPCDDNPTLQHTGSLTAGSESNVAFSSDLEGVSFALAQGELPPGTVLASDGTLTASPR